MIYHLARCEFIARDRPMKKMLCACAVLIMALTTVTALAATDITGTWVGDLTNDSGTYPISFTFKQEGTKLTGTVQPPDGDPLTMTDCKIDGDKISFKVTYNGTVITNEGTITDDEIKLAMKSDQGDPSGGGMTLKRSDPATTPPAIRTEP
jgi:hypothetical protein